MMPKFERYLGENHIFFYINIYFLQLVNSIYFNKNKWYYI